MPKVTIEEFTDNDTRHINYCRDETPVVGIEITPGGTVIVGRWLDDGRWITLHTSTPEEAV